MEKTIPPPDYPGWQKLVRKYQQPDLSKSIWQTVNSFGGLLLCLALMVLALDVGYWLTLLLALPTAGFLVRIFIIQHDCGHFSFFKQRRLNDLFGQLGSVLTLVPYRFWRNRHAVHHAHHAELEERGIGDIKTLTVDEYLARSWLGRAKYRLFRNPFFLFFIAPALKFLVLNRFPVGADRSPKEAASVHWTNRAIFLWYGAMCLLLGWQTVLSIGLPVILIAASVGTWLFYVQHQFEDTYWEHSTEWEFTLAAMEGSSFYRLPGVLQWFTGNIGYHHIHHLSPRIPNYNLQKCHDENPLFQRVTNITLYGSLKTAFLALWDEKQRRLVTFREALRARRRVAAGP